MNYGFIRVAAAALKLKVADPEYNKNEIISAVDKACSNNVKLLVTPELSVTGYTCGDLFFSKSLQQAAENALKDIVNHTKGLDLVLAVGMPVRYLDSIFDCEIIINDGEIAGIVPKINVENFDGHYDKRRFSSGSRLKGCRDISVAGFETKIGQQAFDLGDGIILGAEIGSDLQAVKPPSCDLCLGGANIIINPSADDEYVSKARYRKSLVLNQSARCICAYVYAGAGVYESTSNSVFGGASLIAENGVLLSEGSRFAGETRLVISDVDIERLVNLRRKSMFFEKSDFDIELTKSPLFNEENDMSFRKIQAHPFVAEDAAELKERCEEILQIQARSLARRMEHIGSRGAVVGISGGLDSTLALIVAVRAVKLLGKSSSEVLGVTMPGFGTTDRTYDNAVRLMKALEIETAEISIKQACIQHMRDIGHNEEIKDVTYENTQARERTQILFDLANKHGKLLVGTGDLSELAMGWCTFNGDHMSMYGVNASVPKTLIKHLVKYTAEISDSETAEILLDILKTPVSPELLPPDENGEIRQKTEDSIGPYELHDFFLYNFVRFGFSKEKITAMAVKAFDGGYSEKEINKWIEVFFKRFFISQFKRSCSPDGPKVGTVSLNPHGDWEMPSDASFNAFV